MPKLPITVTGKVTAGLGTARRSGYPTANLEVGRLEIEEGIYLGWASGDLFQEAPAVIFYGVPHALQVVKEPRCEVHLLNYSANLYDSIVTIRLEKFMRPNQKFSTEKELKAAIAKDFSSAKNYFCL